MEQPGLSKIIFQKYDIDHSESISAAEFKNMSYDLGYFLSDTEAELAVKRLDKDCDGSISYEEFKSWWITNDRWSTIKLSEKNMVALQAISAQFQKYDINKNGAIEKKEFKNFWKGINNKKKVSSHEEDTMFKELDANGDGVLTPAELAEATQAECDDATYSDNNDGDGTRFFADTTQVYTNPQQSVNPCLTSSIN